MNKKIDLNIFTNSGKFAPNCELILKAYNSFTNVFGKNIEVKIWCDINPNIEKSKEYHSNLLKIFKNVIITKSFCHGYHSCVYKNNNEYSFMLEHDWEFIYDNLPENLDLLKIIEDMKKLKIFHLRFNKRDNNQFYVRKPNNRHIKAIYIKEVFKELSGDNYKYCLTNKHSNNPHIIDVKFYKKYYLKKIRLNRKGSGGWGGVEDRSNMKLEKKPAIFGELNYPKTIVHLDGKNFSVK